jgi:phage terminase large subunit-like protein
MSPASEISSSQSSLAEKFRQAPIDERRRIIEQLSDVEADALLHDWEFWARPGQLEPSEFASGEKSNWLVMAGRGFGKTRVGSEQVRKWVKAFPIVNLVGPTAADVRDVMVQGTGAGSAIMEICRQDERPEYEKSNRRLTWPNGAVSLLFSAEEPERLRGPQCMKWWGDEVGAWKYPTEVMEQIDFTLRLGSSPQAIYTTTPKPTKVIRELVADPETVITAGSTYDNKANLAQKFFSKIVRKYEGTRLGRQELLAELLTDNPGALWTLTAIDADRINFLPAGLTRIVVGVDPAVTSNEESCETGIVIAAMGPSPEGKDDIPHFYVIDDVSLLGSPEEWAQKVVIAYAEQKADRIIAEVNNGGDLVEAILRTKRLEFAYQAVHATRGKIRRAEPISALYEQHRVHHVGAFPQLEDQMCDYVPGKTKQSPDRMDALVWALWALSEPEEVSDIVTHEEQVQIAPDLDELLEDARNDNPTWGMF